MALAALEPARVLPITPTAEVWSSMSADARDAFLVQVLDALNDPNAVMGEGRPHWLAKSRVLDAMSLHFDALKRVIYLAEELPVLYPGERPFVPDILAVLDVPQSEDDERLGWVVAQEGRGRRSLPWVAFQSCIEKLSLLLVELLQVPRQEIGDLARGDLNSRPHDTTRSRFTGLDRVD